MVVLTEGYGGGLAAYHISRGVPPSLAPFQRGYVNAHWPLNWVSSRIRTFDAMNLQMLRNRILSIRAAIRYHRAQLSDYRCWVDDERLYQLLCLEGAPVPLVPEPEEFAKRCAAFWDNRQRSEERGAGDPCIDSSIAPLPLPEFSDSDLNSMSPQQLEHILTQLIGAIERHRSKGYYSRTVDDDVELYAVLPERVPWSSALPQREVFLGNCARFCTHCQEHPSDLLEWAKEQ